MHNSYKLVLLRDNLVGKCQFFVKLQTVPLFGCHGYRKRNILSYLILCISKPSVDY